jgi:hypothetical protein
MTRIVGGGGKNPVKSVGRPGFTKLDKTGLRRAGRGMVGVVSPRSVRRLFKRNPANRTAIIGTSKDVLGDANQKWNRAETSSPTILKKPSLTQVGTAHKKTKRGPLNNYSNQRITKR